MESFFSREGARDEKKGGCWGGGTEVCVSPLAWVGVHAGHFVLINASIFSRDPLCWGKGRRVHRAFMDQGRDNSSGTLLLIVIVAFCEL